MESIKREREVLKLVHPGRYVEVHKAPIRASEVMRRNPRHSITRPDVFKFPWIVVKPESVLLPGSVFLIVPNHTIYDLLKAKDQMINHSTFSQQNQSLNYHVYQQLKQDSSFRSSVWMSFNLQNHKQYIKGQFVKREKERDGINFHMFNKILLPFSFLFPFSLRIPSCLSETMSHDIENVCQYDWDERSQKIFHVSHEDTKKKMEKESLDESTFEFTPYVALQYYQNNSKDMEPEMPKKDVSLEFESNEQVSLLKSCFSRPDSNRKSLNLKVSFNISIEKEGH